MHPLPVSDLSMRRNRERSIMSNQVFQAVFENGVPDDYVDQARQRARAASLHPTNGEVWISEHRAGDKLWVIVNVPCERRERAIVSGVGGTVTLRRNPKRRTGQGMGAGWSR